MDIEFNTLEMNPHTVDIYFDEFLCSMNEWFMYENPSIMDDMLTWDGWVMWF